MGEMSYELGTKPTSNHAINNDPDEALKLVTAHAGVSVTITPEQEAKLLRKIDLHVMPLLCLVYGLNFVDKTALSYVSIVGFKTDLNLGVSEYNWVASVFYFGYLIWEWPTNRLLQRLPLAKYSACIVILWGLVLASMAAVKDFKGALAVRFFLGVAEASTNPSTVLFTSQWYTVPEQGIRVSWWVSCVGGSQIIGSAVTYGIVMGTTQNPLAIKAWQLIFLAFGGFTVLIGIIFLYWMPDSPLNAWFLTEDEKLVAIERIRINQQGVGNKHFKWYQCKEALTDPMVWGIVASGLFATITNGGITNYFSQLIVSFGFTPTQSLLLSMPEGVIQIVAVLVFAHLGRRFRSRILISSMGLLFAIMGLFLVRFLPLDNRAGRLAGYYLYGFEPVCFLCVFSLISSNVAGWTKKTTTLAMYLISFCTGNIIGPQMYQPSDRPAYHTAITISLVSAGLSLLAFLAVYVWCRRQNAIKASIRAAPGYKKIDGQEFMDLTDRENSELVYAL
ncbi:major facilitator superfamily transporter allantoate [Nemania sp. FL0031]|nr:major facilitator superfamily transporter allantoate [Nemania sp. FL0031]